MNWLPPILLRLSHGHHRNRAAAHQRRDHPVLALSAAAGSAERRNRVKCGLKRNGTCLRSIGSIWSNQDSGNEDGMERCLALEQKLSPSLSATEQVKRMTRSVNDAVGCVMCVKGCCYTCSIVGSAESMRPRSLRSCCGCTALRRSVPKEGGSLDHR